MESPTTSELSPASPEAQEEDPPRRRHPVPIVSLPTRDRLRLNIFFQLAASDMLRFHPSEQVGWIIRFLELLDVEHLATYKQFTHVNYILHALVEDITQRLETGRW